MKYLYYPGCSLSATGVAYDESLQTVARLLGLELELLFDWNCCGATIYMNTDETKAFALSARNLALAERQGNGNGACTLVTPCSACYLIMNKTRHYVKEYPAVAQAVSKALAAAGLEYQGTVPVRHPLDILVNDIGLETIRARVKKRLTGVKVASYYGCLTSRPYPDFDDIRNPQTMDRLVEALGAEPIAWPLKTRCCGGSLMGTMEEVGSRLIYILLKEAERRGADAIITDCPFCQCNLECFQHDVRRRFRDLQGIPVLYFSQLLGIALGSSSKELGLQRSFVPLEAVLQGGAGVH
jgi:heterodisulfide reductase subunit B